MFEKQQRTTSFRPALRLRLARRLARMTALLTLTTLVGGSPTLARQALAAPSEATPFSVPAGSPDEDMQAGADFAGELYPKVEISFWEAEPASLSVSRIEGDSIRCVLRPSGGGQK